MHLQRLVAFLGILTLTLGLQFHLVSHHARAAQKAAGAVAYQVDPVASRIYVKVDSSTRLGHQHGVEGKVKSGKITLGGEGELVFDMASFMADTPEARQRVGVKGKVSTSEAKKVTTAMLSDQVLDVAKHPTATFRITSIAPGDKQTVGELGTYQLEGQFTLHGVEKKLQFKARLEKTDKAGVFKMTGSFPIKHTDYGMTPVSALGGLAKVADEMQISGDLMLSRAAAK